jgi:imidazoleglycerol phosphate dehydratase HisB
MNADDVLKGLARESVKQGENLRSAVRELTLNALRGRELTLTEIKRVIKTVTEGVNLGAGIGKIDAERVLGEAFAGMDEALLKAVQANHLALQQLASQGQSLRETHLNKALDDLERLEDEFLKSIKEAAKSGSKQLKDQWASVLQQKEVAGTETASQIEATMEAFGESMRQAVRQQRRTALKAAEVMSDNFTTLASGILIGLTEGLQQGKSDKTKP